MKNNFTFNLGQININIDGTPVNIENINISVDSEMSVAEMTQSFGMFKSLIDELKSMITPPLKDEEPIEEPKKVINQRWDLDAVWSVIKARAESCFDENGLSRIRWTNKSEDDSKQFEEVEFEFGINDIHMYVRKNQDNFWSYLCEDGSRSYCAIRNSIAKDIIASISDENVREIAMSFLDKVIK